MELNKALGPVEFRFTQPEDIALYGDRWYRYAEADLIRTPARELVALEAALGMPLPDVMNGMRMSTVLGDLAAAWIGVRAYDPKLAGPFNDFNPMALSLTWRAEKVDEGKDPSTDTPSPLADGSPQPDLSQPVTSDPTASVALSNMPVAG
jgi:hypothetical protein